MLAKYKKQARKDIGNGWGVYILGYALTYAATRYSVSVMIWLGLGIQVVGTWWMGQGCVALGQGKGYRVPAWFAAVPVVLSLIPFAAWIPLIVLALKEDKFGRINIEVAQTDLQPRLLKVLQIESRGDIAEALAAYKQIYEEAEQALAQARRQMDGSGLKFDASMTWVVEESFGDTKRVGEEARVCYETLAKKYADQQPAPALAA